MLTRRSLFRGALAGFAVAAVSRVAPWALPADVLPLASGVPSPPVAGQLWFSTTGTGERLHVYLSDDDGWVEVDDFFP